MNGAKTEVKVTITPLLSAVLSRAVLRFVTCSLFPGVLFPAQSGPSDNSQKSEVKVLAACSVFPRGPHHLFPFCAICNPLVLVLICLPISCVLLLIFRGTPLPFGVLHLSYRCVSSCQGWLPPL